MPSLCGVDVWAWGRRRRARLVLRCDGRGADSSGETVDGSRRADEACAVDAVHEDDECLQLLAQLGRGRDWMGWQARGQGDVGKRRVVVGDEDDAADAEHVERQGGLDGRRLAEEEPRAVVIAADLGDVEHLELLVHGLAELRRVDGEERSAHGSAVADRAARAPELIIAVLRLRAHVDRAE